MALASAASCGSAALNMPLIASQAARVLTVSVGSSAAAELACVARFHAVRLWAAYSSQVVRCHARLVTGGSVFPDVGSHQSAGNATMSRSRKRVYGCERST